MGRSKRKTVSPLQKDTVKSRRTGQEASVSDVDEDCESQVGQKEDLIRDLKDFIRNENMRNNRALSEEIRKYNDERVSALENSLSFALTTSETLAKRLAEVEGRARQAEKDFGLCAQRLAELERELDQMQQRELKDWLIFSGPAIPRLARTDGPRREDTSGLLHTMLQQLMNYSLDKQQIAEMHREERRILVRFSEIGAGSDRYVLVRNKTRLRGSGLYIKERLTPNRQRLYNELMQLKRDDKLSTVFTRDGTVFAVVGRNDRPRPVRSDAALESLCRQLAELTADGRRGPAERRSPSAVRRWEAAGRGRVSVLGDSLTSDPGAGASVAMGRPESSPSHVIDDAGRSAERRRPSSRRPTDGGGAVTGDDTVCRSGAPLVTPVDLAASDSGPDGAGRPLAESGGDDGDGGGGQRPPVFGEPPAALPESATVSRPRSDEADRPGAAAAGGGGGDVGGGGGRRPTVATGGRPMVEAAGVRRRFGGDIRQFAKLQSKCD